MDNSTPSTMMSPPKKRSSDLGHLSSNEKQCILYMYKQQLGDEPDKKSPYLKFPRHLAQITIFFSIFKKDDLYRMLQSLREIQEDSTCASEKLRRKMIYEAKILKILARLSLVLLFVVVCLCNPIVSDDLYFMGWYFKKYFPEYYNIAMTLYYVSFSFMAYSMVVYVFVHAYFCYHATFQLAMVTELVESIDFDYHDHDVGTLMHNEKYQKLIADRLKYVVQRHQHGNRIFSLSRKTILLPVTAYVITGMLAILSLIEVVLINRSNVNIMMSVGITLILGSVSLYMFCVDGQQMSDASEELRRAIHNIPYYTWDKTNRITLLIILGNLKNYVLIIPGMVRVDNTLVSSVMQFVWSSATILQKMNNLTEN